MLPLRNQEEYDHIGSSYYLDAQASPVECAATDIDDRPRCPILGLEQTLAFARALVR
jgi:ABC-type phosphonate transport system ATPase subunit